MRYCPRARRPSDCPVIHASFYLAAVSACLLCLTAGHASAGDQSPGSKSAAAPVDDQLIPEARRVLNYLHSVYGKRTVSGMSSYGGWQPVFHMTGRMPAIYGVDAFGWNKPVWGESYRRVLQGAIDDCHSWWHDRGGLVAMQYHWGKPGDPKGSAWSGGRKGTGPVDVAATVTPGTPEHKAAMDDLRRTADYLEQLHEARVPVLWRPLHEIDGGWFWWTDVEEPESTAALWRMMFDYFVHERKLHNLIWVYSAGLKPGNLGRDASPEDEIAYRKRFYPGAEYVDIAGIDIYPNEYFGWESYRESAYPRAEAIMKKVAPGKILAMCECAAIPNPDMMQQQGPCWLYALPWFTGGQNPPDWIRKTYTHPHVITMDQLPALVPHNVAPWCRLVEPGDGDELAARSTEVVIEAADRDDNLKEIQLLALAGPWKNWALRDTEELAEALEEATPIGTATVDEKGRCRIAWAKPSPGLWTLVARARDGKGASSLSNPVRLTVGLEDLARDKPVTASSDEDGAADAVDGDLLTAWSGAKEGPQWISVDLGRSRTISRVVAAWWKAYAKDYRIQVSTDAEQWTDVAQIENKNRWHGDTDLLRFDPIEARFVRLYATRRGTSWGGYTLYELRVFE
jgi:mannan endo-1,4-beta-mannosidase